MGLCRLCASLKESEQLIHVEEQSNEICQKLQKCCGVSIQMSDVMPKTVCQPCVDHLNVSYNFYSKVQEAQETLKALFHSKLAETPIHDVFLQRDDSLPKDIPPHTSKQVVPMQKEEIHSAREQLFIIKTEQEDFETEEKQNILFLSQQVEQRNDNKAGTRDYSPFKDIPYPDTYKQYIKAEKEGKVEKEICEIKIEKEDMEHLKQEADTESSGIFTVENVSEDVSKGSNLHEVYNTIGMSHVVVDEDTVDDVSDENESMGFLVTTIVKEEEMMQEEQSSTFLETRNTSVQSRLNYGELEEDSIQNIGIEERNEDYNLLPTENQLNSWKCYIHLCYACNYTTSRFEDLIIHAYGMHSISDKNKLQYKCYDCQNVIEHYNDFLNHVRLKHHPALKLRCDACDILCTDNKQYELHRNVNCVEAEKFPNNLKCSYCCKTFRTLGRKQAHIRQHIEGFPKIKFECQQCHKEFLSKRSLHLHEKIHKNTHADKTIYRCKICQKGFNIERYLVKHQIIHSDEKPFKCSFCPREFRTKIEQTNHERVHTGEMPFQCSHCEKRFRFRSALSAHLNTHSGIRAHTCKYCSRQFKDRSNLKKHIIFKHAEEESKKIIGEVENV